MMTLDANKQKMKYSQKIDSEPIYLTDDDENIIYDDVTGEPVETGEYKTGYSNPVSFCANISNKLNEIAWKDYGIDNSAEYGQLICSKNELPLKKGDLIWKKSSVSYKNDGTVDGTSADYIVKGIADEGLSEDLFLLKRNVK